MHPHQRYSILGQQSMQRKGERSQKPQRHRPAPSPPVAESVASEAHSEDTKTPPLLVVTEDPTPMRCTNYMRIVDSHLLVQASYDPKTCTHSMVTKELLGRAQSLRAVYTAAGALFALGLFVVCIQTLRDNASRGITLIAMIHGFASVMVLAGRFCAILWTGRRERSNSIQTLDYIMAEEWFHSIVMLGCPLLVLCGALITKSERVVTLTATTWMVCVGLAFSVFVIQDVLLELTACMEQRDSKQSIDDSTKHNNTHRASTDPSKWLLAAQSCIHKRQVRTYCIQRTTTRFHKWTWTTSSTSIDTSIHVPNQFTNRWFHLVKLMHLQCLPFFTALEERLESSNDAVDGAPDFEFLYGASSWRLESLLCLPSTMNFVMVLRGSDALTTSQIRSSFLFTMLGTAAIPILILCAMVWLDRSTTTLVVATGGLSFAAFISIQETLQLKAAMEEPENRQGEVEHVQDDGWRDGIFVSRRCERYAVPTALTCMVLFVLEQIVFVAYPFWTLLRMADGATITVFAMSTLLSNLDYYFDPALIMEEGVNRTRNLANAKVHSSSSMNDSHRISHAERRHPWLIAFWTIGLIFVAQSPPASKIDLKLTPVRVATPPPPAKAEATTEMRQPRSHVVHPTPRIGFPHTPPNKTDGLPANNSTFDDRFIFMDNADASLSTPPGFEYIAMRSLWDDDSVPEEEEPIPFETEPGHNGTGQHDRPINRGLGGRLLLNRVTQARFRRTRRFATSASKPGQSSTSATAEQGVIRHTRTLNVSPHRDFMPLIDEFVDGTKHIQCYLWNSDFADCRGIADGFCEAMPASESIHRPESAILQLRYNFLELSPPQGICRRLGDARPQEPGTAGTKAHADVDVPFQPDHNSASQRNVFGEVRTFYRDAAQRQLLDFRFVFTFCFRLFASPKTDHTEQIDQAESADQTTLEAPHSA